MYDKIKKDLTEAMKSGDKFKLDVIRMLKASIMNEETSGGEKHELSDEDILSLIKREVKKRKSSIEEYQKYNKTDAVNDLLKEIDILSAYLPKELTDDELNKAIDGVFAEVKPESMKDMGKIMKEMQAKYGSVIDSSKVSKIVKDRLSK